MDEELGIKVRQIGIELKEGPRESEVKEKKG